MITAGDRLDTTGILGGIINNNLSKTNGYSILRNLTGKETLICGEQWDKVYENLVNENKNRPFDANWNFADDHGFGHLRGKATSSDSGDPVIHLDPWKNDFHTSNPNPSPPQYLNLLDYGLP